MAKKDQVLLKLRRNYTEHEAFNYVDDLLRKAHMELGILLSEKQELEAKIVLQKSTIGNAAGHIERLKLEINDYKKGLKLEKRIVELTKANATRQKRLKKLDADVNLWRNKYFDLKAKNEPTKGSK